jgi:hypothetical protein
MLAVRMLGDPGLRFLERASTDQAAAGGRRGMNHAIELN